MRKRPPRRHRRSWSRTSRPGRQSRRPPSHRRSPRGRTGRPGTRKRRRQSTCIPRRTPGSPTHCRERRCPTRRWTARSRRGRRRIPRGRARTAARPPCCTFPARSPRATGPGMRRSSPQGTRGSRPRPPGSTCPQDTTRWRRCCAMGRIHPPGRQCRTRAHRRSTSQPRTAWKAPRSGSDMRILADSACSSPIRPARSSRTRRRWSSSGLRSRMRSRRGTRRSFRRLRASRYRGCRA